MKGSISRMVGKTLAAGLLAATVSFVLAPQPAVAKPVPATKMTFTIVDHHVKVGQAITGPVLLQTRSGSKWLALPNASLSVTVDGTQVVTLTTDSAGRATVSYTTTSRGDHVIRVIYAGDSTHKGAQRSQGFSVG